MKDEDVKLEGKLLDDWLSDWAAGLHASLRQLEPQVMQQQGVQIIKEDLGYSWWRERLQRPLRPRGLYAGRNMLHRPIGVERMG